MEKDDYQSDSHFGVWLKEQRSRLNMTLEQVSEASCIPVSRIKSLEMGYAEKGINQVESEKLSSIYKVTLKSFLQHAAGD